MAKLHLVHGHDPAALLEAGADAFLQAARSAAPFSSPSCLLALRQGGLRDDLFALAEARGVRGWFDPPLCVFSELPRWLGSTPLRPLGAFERAALIAGLMHAEGRPTFRDRDIGIVRALDQWFGELRAEGVTPATYASAMSRLGPRERFEEERDAALLRMYEAYTMELARSGLRDGRDALADSASAVRASPDGLAERLGRRREIRLLGLTDLRGGWRPLLAALVESPAIDRVVTYSCSRMALPVRLEHSVERLSAAVPEPPLEPPASMRVLTGPNADRELEAVASAARKLIDGGVAAHRIAVVARQARPHTDQAVHALKQAGLPVTARQRLGWGEVPCVRAVLALFEAAAEGWSRHGLAVLGSQPYLSASIDVRVVNFLGYRERIVGLAEWAGAMDRLLVECRAAEAAASDDGEPRTRALPSEWVERAAERFREFANLAGELEPSRSVIAWLEWLVDWLERDPLGIARRLARVPGGRWEVVRLDLLGWRGLRGRIADWLAAERRWPGEASLLPIGAFLGRLRVMLHGDVALRIGPARGVQVLEAPAASHRVFDHVFLVGMNAGRFPRRPPSSLLLGDRDREALAAAGLPLDTSSDWEVRERDLFRVLLAGAKHLTVSYTTLDESGADSIPSSFVETLLETTPAERAEAGSVPFAGMPALGAHAHRNAVIARERATGRLSPWNGGIEDAGLRAWLAESFGDAKIWSPTSIEGYAKCPWAWVSSRVLRLTLREDPDSDVDPRARGSVLHDALRRFYEAAARRTGGLVFLESSDAEWARPLLRESLGRALEAAAGRVWLGHPALRPAKHAELERMLLAFLDFEVGENEKARDGRTRAGKMVRTAVAEHESPFDAVLLERDGVQFRFRGILDRIEVGTDVRAPGSWVAAVDYKTTVWSCPGAGKTAAWEDGVVLQVPLYAWALSVLRPGTQVARVEYRAIKQAARVHCLGLARVGKSGVSEGAEERARMESALSAVARHVKRVRQGEFPAAPAPSCGCPPFCHGWDVCRVAGGPKTGRD